MKRIVLGICIGNMLLLAEPSVYANRTYGNRTADTKTIISLKRQVAQLKERIDGLTSIVEGLSASIHVLKEANQNPPSTNQNRDSVKLLEELGEMIDEINKNYVSREELKEIIQAKKIIDKPKKHSIGSNLPKNHLASKEAAKLYSEGVRLFMKKRYDEAKKRFMLADEKGYKPAASNYYLGEIAYYTKQYEDAIFYYKKSAGLYDKASYIDVLLLHTAISLEKTGEKAQARAFYENIIENYPDKKSAMIAKKKLEK